MLWFFGCGFSVIQVKASKFTENDDQENRKSRGVSNNING